MNKPKLNYLLDFFMGITFTVTAVTGLIMFVFLPRGIPKEAYQIFLGINKNCWALVHDWSGIALIVLVIIHLIFHWNWIIIMTKNLLSRKNSS